MRAALFSLAGSGQSPIIAGKTLAERQLDFALAFGAERIVALGDGASSEAIGLRHIAERAGARFQAVRDAHGLLGAVAAADQLLVLAAGLLPEAPVALDSLRRAAGILILPAQAGAAAGFERIDLERAWAGALVAPGGLIERLAELPPDSEPAPALLRIALHARLPEERLPEAILADGSWAVVKPADADLLGRRWLGRHLPPAEVYAPSRQFARHILRLCGPRLLAAPMASRALDGGAALLLAAAMALAWFGLAADGFVAVAGANLLLALGAGLARLRDAPFHPRRGRLDWRSAMSWLVDAALIICALSAIQGHWFHRLFPPLVLIGALRSRNRSKVASLPEDRALLALVLAAATAFGMGEAAGMLLAVAVIALDAAKTALVRG